MNVWNFEKNPLPDLTERKTEILKKLIGKEIEISFIRYTNPSLGHMCWVIEGRLERIEGEKIKLAPSSFNGIKIETIYSIKEL